jgi:hypothetical protein
MKTLHNNEFQEFEWISHSNKTNKENAAMLRLGCPPPKTREMDLDDIYFSRLKLLIIMAKAFINGYPLGEPRRQAILENARHVETESIDLGNLIIARPWQSSADFQSEVDHVFYQRVKLLAVMMKAVAKGFPMGDNRKKAMCENLEIICQTLLFTSRTEDMDFLKVA